MTQNQKKSKETMQIQVGIFVAVGLFLLMLVIFLLGSEKKLFDTQYRLICYFTDISGLRVGAPVQLAGIRVGTVNEILFDEKIEEKKVRLELQISTRYEERIREDSVASIVTQGLLGDKMVFISVGSSETKPLESGAELKSKSPTGFSQILEKSDSLVEAAEQIADNLNNILHEVRDGDGVLHGIIYEKHGEEIVTDIKLLAENFREASASIASVSHKINEGHGTIGAFINDASVFNDLKTLLGKANRNKLIKAVVRYTLKTKDENLLKKD